MIDFHETSSFSNVSLFGDEQGPIGSGISDTPNTIRFTRTRFENVRMSAAYQRKDVWNKNIERLDPFDLIQFGMIRWTAAYILCIPT